MSFFVSCPAHLGLSKNERNVFLGCADAASVSAPTASLRTAITTSSSGDMFEGEFPDLDFVKHMLRHVAVNPGISGRTICSCLFSSRHGGAYVNSDLSILVSPSLDDVHVSSSGKQGLH